MSKCIRISSGLYAVHASPNVWVNIIRVGSKWVVCCHYAPITSIERFVRDMYIKGYHKPYSTKTEALKQIRLAYALSRN